MTGELRKSDFAAAVLEGISFAEKQVLETSEKLNGESHPLVKLGGHAGNDSRWKSIRLRTLRESKGPKPIFSAKKATPHGPFDYTDGAAELEIHC